MEVSQESQRVLNDRFSFVGDMLLYTDLCIVYLLKSLTDLFLSSSEGQRVLEIVEANANWIIKPGCVILIFMYFSSNVKMIKKMQKGLINVQYS